MTIGRGGGVMEATYGFGSMRSFATWLAPADMTDLPDADIHGDRRTLAIPGFRS